MASTPSEFGSFYNEKRAAADLRRYRMKGPQPWTRALIETVKDEGVAGATLLDIGGGVGEIAHELLAAGAARATCVEASAAYLAAAREESERRGESERVSYHHGDFVELASEIPPADIVTLNRVLNVSPDWEQLTSLSAARARRLYGVVIPRDRRTVGLVIWAMNLMLRLRGQPLRAATRPIEAIDRLVSEQGLRRFIARDAGPVWQVLIYRRP
jgi:hypothetical protein